MVEEFVQKHQLDYSIETSAKQNENVDDLFTICAQMLYDKFKDQGTERNKGDIADSQSDLSSTSPTKKL